MKKCLLCNKKFAERNKGTSKEKRYCSERCGSIYRERKAYLNKTKPIYAKLHPKEYNKLIRKNYHKFKDIWKSRMITNQFLKQIPNLNKLLKIRCKKCKTIHYLQIHHEIYPITHAKIIEAILNGKIYFLCRKCHNLLKRKVYKV